MIRPEAVSVLRTVFAPFQHIDLTEELIDVWFSIALQPCGHLEGLRIAQALASTCDYPPVPKQFLEMRHASRLPERKALPSVDNERFEVTDNGRVWARHIAGMMRALSASKSHVDDAEPVDVAGHTPISGDSWAKCAACREYSRELAMQAGVTSGGDVW